MIESAIEHALYWDLERMLKKRILNRTLDQEHALCLLGNYFIKIIYLILDILNYHFPPTRSQPTLLNEKNQRHHNPI